MKIQIKNYNETFTWDSGHQDVNLKEAMRGFVGLLKASGFSSKSVDEYHDALWDK